MEIRQLEIFLAVLEARSVTRAAERVFLSPGAVSMQIHALAQELRTDLFARSGRQFVPTQAALRLGEQARALVDQARVIRRQFEDDPRSDDHPFRFATGATTLIHCLGKPLRGIRRRYPKIDIQVTVSVTEEIVAGVLARQFDLGLISLPYSGDGLRITPLFEEELLVLAPSAKLVRGNRVTPIAVSELARASFLLYPKSSNMRTMIDRFFEDLGIRPRVVMEADDTEAIKSLVEAGFGYSLLPEQALRGHPRYFRRFRVPSRRLMRTQALAVARTAYSRALTSAVIALLQEQLGSL